LNEREQVEGNVPAGRFAGGRREAAGHPERILSELFGEKYEGEAVQAELCGVRGFYYMKLLDILIEARHCGGRRLSPMKWRLRQVTSGRL